MKPIICNIFLILLLACQSQTDLENAKETELINDIFIELAERLPIYHVNEIIPPPPPAPIFNDKFEIIGVDSTLFKKQIIEHNQKIENRKNKNIDTTCLVVAISDTMISMENYWRDLNRIEFEGGEYDKLISLYKRGEKEKRKIDLNKLKISGKYKLVYETTLPKNSLTLEAPFEFGGIIQFSRIYINEENNKALFYCSYFCGRDCGISNMIYLKKSSNKWIINGIQMLGVS